jgi:hypothetical protein
MYSPSYIFDCEMMSLSTHQQLNWIHPKNLFDPISVKDFSIQDIRIEIGYNTEVSKPKFCKFGPILDSPVQIYQPPNKLTLTLLMFYKEAFKVKHNSHPLQNIKLNKKSYIDDMPPDWNRYAFYIPIVRTFEDVKIVNTIKWLWINHRLNYDAWVKMVMALFSAHRRYQIYPIENGFVEERASAKVAIDALIGPRGLIHGLWNFEVPRLQIGYDRLHIWPKDWKFDFNINDNSSFHSSSPDNSDFDTDGGDSGPIGIAYNRPRITGFTSFTETSSDEEASRLDVFSDGHGGEYWDRRFRKRFDLYIRTSTIERRNRRAVREARRLVRLKYDEERREEETAYNAEAKRAEALAAERIHTEIRNRENKKRIEYLRQSRSNKQKSLDHYLCRYQQFNHKLRSILEHEWKWYYGENHESQYNQRSEKHISLNCWISPVHWVRPTEEK